MNPTKRISILLRMGGGEDGLTILKVDRELELLKTRLLERVSKTRSKKLIKEIIKDEFDGHN